MIVAADPAAACSTTSDAGPYWLFNKNREYQVVLTDLA